ncbi:lactosylceramide 1,3-N-acetyl-beta-D-glucosaminyltransferase B-like [Oscarella lobularis]|uniref:lactosylceramide 1,3-N-acetyl-beta-D-glucosaminyltransferase B-like n=1 Tax=Oscarella lobularis TaxID=121494 RepID=UPI003313F6E8
MLRCTPKRAIIGVLGLSATLYSIYTMTRPRTSPSEPLAASQSQARRDRVEITFRKPESIQKRADSLAQPRQCRPIEDPLQKLPPDVPHACVSTARHFSSAGFCKKDDVDSVAVDLVIFIPSPTKNFRQRHFARSRWLRASFGSKTNNWKYFFVVGVPRGGENAFVEQRALDVEKCHYADVLQIPVEENESNRTAKLFVAFRWLVASTYRNFKFVLKTNENSVVHPGHAIRWLNEEAANDGREPLYGGRCDFDLRPNRDPKSASKISTDLFPFDRYPPICDGSGYFLSKSLLEEILRYSSMYPVTFFRDDVYVGIRVSEVTSFKARIINTKLISGEGDEAECSASRRPFIVTGNGFAELSSLYEALLKGECPVLNRNGDPVQ